MNDIVSIITPCYNSEDFLGETIKSVISQTYVYWEMIIVDDNSSDCSRKIIEGFASKEDRITPIFLDYNTGPAKARNVALSQAKGRYIAFLDSDDLWSSEKLERQIDFMEKSNIAFSFTTYTRIEQSGSKKLGDIIAPKVMSYKSYLSNTIIGCLTVMLDRNIIRNIRMKDLRSSHDMALWLDIMKQGFRAYGLNQNLARYRVVETSNTAQKWRAAIDVWFVYRRVEKLNLIYSLYCFIGYVFNAIKKRI